MVDSAEHTDPGKIYSVPDSPEERNRLRQLIASFISGKNCRPPLSMENLSHFAGGFILENGLEPQTKGWVMVEMNNCVWQDTVASIPFEKRILLLPKCLSNTGYCQAEVDELGLLCHRCHHCSIPNLQDTADKLGMMSIVAEGFTSAIELIENRVMDAVIGVSCLESLEKAFPLLINNAVPGMAIPLNGAGCRDTHVDLGYLHRVMGMHSGKYPDILDYDLLKSTIKDWFAREKLSAILSAPDDPTTSIAHEWMGKDGKRWRPYLLTATYMALKGENHVPDLVHAASVAVECFHKASLIHDDIQDNDSYRNGRLTVNAEWGVPMAINAGDLLIGEGYRLLAGCGNMELIRAAVLAHNSLCIGQGMELAWSASPSPLTMDQVIGIFCHKTVPAFEVALIMGVICAGDDLPLRAVISQYSRELGIAYQLLDDLGDFDTDEPVALRPSAVLAAICENHPDGSFMEEILHTPNLKSFLNQREHQPLLQEALLKVRHMAVQYHQRALEALQNLANVELKRLLFRVTHRILKLP